MSGDRPLAGTTVVVTRPVDQAPALAAALESAGATAIVVPALAIEDPPDGGATLRNALTLTPFDWVVVTSANGARALARAVDRTGVDLPAVAAVGPRTAEQLERLGIEVTLVPETFVAEALVDAFPAGRSAVLVVRPEVARTVVADGLRAKGHGVTEIIAYRTAPAPIGPSAAEAARAADVVTFTSPLAYRAFVEQVGRPQGQVVVSIGPVTTAAIGSLEDGTLIEADPHTVTGMVASLVEHRGRR